MALHVLAHMIPWRVAFLLAAMVLPIFAHAQRTTPFIIGADISWVPEDESAGAKYFDQGVQKDIFVILKEHGFNYVRLRVFVDPKSERGYARRLPEAFCDLEHTKAMAKRAQAAGMGFFLDFHYSDNWADPGKQTKPLAWEAFTVPQLAQAVHEHTRTVVQALKDQGTPPQMVQVGNEITGGMLWPEGRYDRFDDFATLVKAGITAVREVDPSIRVVLHHDKGKDFSKVRWWMDNLLSRDVQFDIIAISCYDQVKEGDWKRTLAELATHYPAHDLLIAEYSARKQEINAMAMEVPGRKCLGTFIWEPTRHKEAIFDQDGHNAGGGDPYYFSTTRPSERRPTTSTRSAPQNPPQWRLNRGGRYDTNDYIRVYPTIAKEAENDAKK